MLVIVSNCGIVVGGELFVKGGYVFVIYLFFYLIFYLDFLVNLYRVVYGVGY